jgi:rRNA maturation endonuclease Nob1
MFELKPCPFCGGTKLKVERKSRLAGWNGLDISGYRCSKCRRIVGFDLTPYCPNCGAKMDGGDSNADKEVD